MAGNKYIATDPSGVNKEVAALQASAGAGSAGAIVALNAAGSVDTTMLPTGVGPTTQTLTASEALAAGAYVNVWNNGGVFAARNADASAGNGKPAHGFVLAAVASGAAAVVYFDGQDNTSVTGQTPGPVFLSKTNPGQGVTAAPSGAGVLLQRIGLATQAATVVFNPTAGVVLAS